MTNLNDKPIITSLCDLDFYKLTMMNFAYYYENNTQVKYKFTCRTPVDFTKCFEEIETQIQMLGDLRFTEDEINYLGTFSFFRSSFLRYLRGFRLDPNDVSIRLNADGGLGIVIKAPWVNGILFETLIMSIICEVYFKTTYADKYDMLLADGRVRLDKKIEYLNSLGRKMPFAEFGTRRRFSQEHQEYVVRTLKDSGYEGFVGTSNVDLARRLNLKVIGTMAHEIVMVHGGITRPDKSNKLAMERWLDFYEGDLGTALTDTYTTDHFLKDFNGTLARGFTGVRQDSGDPIKWGKKMLANYYRLGIDAKEKMLLFSDGLNFEKSFEIFMEFENSCKVSFGIGTDLTCDMGVPALNIVIKAVECEGFPLIKISDSPGKTMCEDRKYKEFVLELFGAKV